MPFGTAIGQLYPTGQVKLHTTAPDSTLGVRGVEIINAEPSLALGAIGLRSDPSWSVCAMVIKRGSWKNLVCQMVGYVRCCATDKSSLYLII